jgi:hypothetical protein
VIPLDDVATWHALQGAYGPADKVREILVRLEEAPDSFEDDPDDLFGIILHQGDTYPASYAAVPHLVAIGRRARPDQAAFYWALVGGIGAHGVDAIPDALRTDCERALHDADEPIRATIAACPRDQTIWYLLIAAAGIRGLGDTGYALEQFVESLFDVDCPSCGETVEIAREDALPGPPLPSLDPAAWRWTDDDAPARLLALARLAQRPDVEAVLLAWDGTVSCPSCDAPFRLRPAQLSTLRSWSD